MKATFFKSVTREAAVPWRGVWSVHFGEPEDEDAEHISWLSKILTFFRTKQIQKYGNCMQDPCYICVCVHLHAHLDLFENPKGIEAKTK